MSVGESISGFFTRFGSRARTEAKPAADITAQAQKESLFTRLKAIPFGNNDKATVQLGLQNKVAPPPPPRKFKFTGDEAGYRADADSDFLHAKLYDRPPLTTLSTSVDSQAKTAPRSMFSDPKQMPKIATAAAVSSIASFMLAHNIKQNLDETQNLNEAMVSSAAQQQAATQQAAQVEAERPKLTKRWNPVSTIRGCFERLGERTTVILDDSSRVTAEALNRAPRSPRALAVQYGLGAGAVLSAGFTALYFYYKQGSKPGSETGKNTTHIVTSLVHPSPPRLERRFNPLETLRAIRERNMINEGIHTATQMVQSQEFGKSMAIKGGLGATAMFTIAGVMLYLQLKKNGRGDVEAEATHPNKPTTPQPPIEELHLLHKRMLPLELEQIPPAQRAPLNARALAAVTVLGIIVSAAIGGTLWNIWHNKYKHRPVHFSTHTQEKRMNPLHVAQDAAAATREESPRLKLKDHAIAIAVGLSALGTGIGAGAALWKLKHLKKHPEESTEPDYPYHVPPHPRPLQKRAVTPEDLALKAKLNGRALAATIILASIVGVFGIGATAWHIVHQKKTGQRPVHIPTHRRSLEKRMDPLPEVEHGVEEVSWVDAHAGPLVMIAVLSVIASGVGAAAAIVKYRQKHQHFIPSKYRRSLKKRMDPSEVEHHVEGETSSWIEDHAASLLTIGILSAIANGAGAAVAIAKYRQKKLEHQLDDPSKHKRDFESLSKRAVPFNVELSAEERVSAWMHENSKPFAIAAVLFLIGSGAGAGAAVYKYRQRKLQRQRGSSSLHKRDYKSEEDRLFRRMPPPSVEPRIGGTLSSWMRDNAHFMTVLGIPSAVGSGAGVAAAIHLMRKTKLQRHRIDFSAPKHKRDLGQSLDSEVPFLSERPLPPTTNEDNEQPHVRVSPAARARFAAHHLEAQREMKIFKGVAGGLGAAALLIVGGFYGWYKATHEKAEHVRPHLPPFEKPNLSKRDLGGLSESEVPFLPKQPLPPPRAVEGVRHPQTAMPPRERARLADLMAEAQRERKIFKAGAGGVGLVVLLVAGGFYRWYEATHPKEEPPKLSKRMMREEVGQPRVFAPLDVTTNGGGGVAHGVAANVEVPIARQPVEKWVLVTIGAAITAILALGGYTIWYEKTHKNKEDRSFIPPNHKARLTKRMLPGMGDEVQPPRVVAPLDITTNGGGEAIAHGFLPNARVPLSDKIALATVGLSGVALLIIVGYTVWYETTHQNKQDPFYKPPPRSVPLPPGMRGLQKRATPFWLLAGFDRAVGSHSNVISRNPEDGLDPIRQHALAVTYAALMLAGTGLPIWYMLKHRKDESKGKHHLQKRAPPVWALPEFGHVAGGQRNVVPRLSDADLDTLREFAVGTAYTALMLAGAGLPIWYVLQHKKALIKRKQHLKKRTLPFWMLPGLQNAGRSHSSDVMSRLAELDHGGSALTPLQELGRASAGAALLLGGVGAGIWYAIKHKKDKSRRKQRLEKRALALESDVIARLAEAGHVGPAPGLLEQMAVGTAFAAVVLTAAGLPIWYVLKRQKDEDKSRRRLMKRSTSEITEWNDGEGSRSNVIPRFGFPLSPVPEITVDEGSPSDVLSRVAQAALGNRAAIPLGKIGVPSPSLSDFDVSEGSPSNVFSRVAEADLPNRAELVLGKIGEAAAAAVIVLAGVGLPTWYALKHKKDKNKTGKQHLSKRLAPIGHFHEHGAVRGSTQNSASVAPLEFAGGDEGEKPVGRLERLSLAAIGVGAMLIVGGVLVKAVVDHEKEQRRRAAAAHSRHLFKRMMQPSAPSAVNSPLEIAGDEARLAEKRLAWSQTTHVLGLAAVIGLIAGATGVFYQVMHKKKEQRERERAAAANASSGHLSKRMLPSPSRTAAFAPLEVVQDEARTAERYLSKSELAAVFGLGAAALVAGSFNFWLYKKKQRERRKNQQHELNFIHRFPGSQHTQLAKRGAPLRGDVEAVVSGFYALYERIAAARARRARDAKIAKVALGLSAVVLGGTSAGVAGAYTSSALKKQRQRGKWPRKRELTKRFRPPLRDVEAAVSQLDLLASRVATVRAQRARSIKAANIAYALSAVIFGGSAGALAGTYASRYIRRRQRQRSLDVARNPLGKRELSKRVIPELYAAEMVAAIHEHRAAMEDARRLARLEALVNQIAEERARQRARQRARNDKIAKIVIAIGAAIAGATAGSLAGIYARDRKNRQRERLSRARITKRFVPPLRGEVEAIRRMAQLQALVRQIDLARAAQRERNTRIANIAIVIGSIIAGGTAGTFAGIYKKRQRERSFHVAMPPHKRDLTKRLAPPLRAGEGRPLIQPNFIANYLARVRARRERSTVIANIATVIVSGILGGAAGELASFLEKKRKERSERTAPPLHKRRIPLTREVEADLWELPREVEEDLREHAREAFIARRRHAVYRISPLDKALTAAAVLSTLATTVLLGVIAARKHLEEKERAAFNAQHDAEKRLSPTQPADHLLSKRRIPLPREAEEEVFRKVEEGVWQQAIRVRRRPVPFHMTRSEKILSVAVVLSTLTSFGLLGAMAVRKKSKRKERPAFYPPQSANPFDKRATITPVEELAFEQATTEATPRAVDRGHVVAVAAAMLSLGIAISTIVAAEVMAQRKAAREARDGASLKPVPKANGLYKRYAIAGPISLFNGRLTEVAALQARTRIAAANWRQNRARHAAALSALLVGSFGLTFGAFQAIRLQQKKEREEMGHRLTRRSEPIGEAMMEVEALLLAQQRRAARARAVAAERKFLANIAVVLGSIAAGGTFVALAERRRKIRQQREMEQLHIVNRLRLAKRRAPQPFEVEEGFMEARRLMRAQRRAAERARAIDAKLNLVASVALFLGSISVGAAFYALAVRRERMRKQREQELRDRAYHLSRRSRVAPVLPQFFSDAVELTSHNPELVQLKERLKDKAKLYALVGTLATSTVGIIGGVGYTVYDLVRLHKANQRLKAEERRKAEQGHLSKRSRTAPVAEGVLAAAHEITNHNPELDRLKEKVKFYGAVGGVLVGTVSVVTGIAAAIAALQIHELKRLKAEQDLRARPDRTLPLGKRSRTAPVNEPVFSAAQPLEVLTHDPELHRLSQKAKFYASAGATVVGTLGRIALTAVLIAVTVKNLKSMHKKHNTLSKRALLGLGELREVFSAPTRPLTALEQKARTRKQIKYASIFVAAESVKTYLLYLAIKRHEEEKYRSQRRLDKRAPVTPFDGVEVAAAEVVAGNPPMEEARRKAKIYAATIGALVASAIAGAGIGYVIHVIIDHSQPKPEHPEPFYAAPDPNNAAPCPGNRLCKRATIVPLDGVEVEAAQEVDGNAQTEEIRRTAKEIAETVGVLVGAGAGIIGLSYLFHAIYRHSNADGEVTNGKRYPGKGLGRRSLSPSKRATVVPMDGVEMEAAQAVDGNPRLEAQLGEARRTAKEAAKWIGGLTGAGAGAIGLYYLFYTIEKHTGKPPIFDASNQDAYGRHYPGPSKGLGRRSIGAGEGPPTRAILMRIFKQLAIGTRRSGLIKTTDIFPSSPDQEDDTPPRRRPRRKMDKREVRVSPYRFPLAMASIIVAVVAWKAQKAASDSDDGEASRVHHSRRQPTERQLEKRDTQAVHVNAYRLPFAVLSIAAAVIAYKLGKAVQHHEHPPRYGDEPPRRTVDAASEPSLRSRTLRESP